MKIIVRKMPDMILDKSFKQIEGLYETCYGGNAIETYLKSIEMSKDDDCLNLEDDIILCNDFLNKVKKIIAKYPDKVITFFTLKNRPIGENIEPARNYCMSQCTYIPRWVNNLLPNFSKKWLEDKNGRGYKATSGVDYLLADFLDLMKEKYVLYQPSLVQHMEMKSRIDPRRSTHRISKTFKEN